MDNIILLNLNQSLRDYELERILLSFRKVNRATTGEKLNENEALENNEAKKLNLESQENSTFDLILTSMYHLLNIGYKASTPSIQCISSYEILPSWILYTMIRDIYASIIATLPLLSPYMQLFIGKCNDHNTSTWRSMPLNQYLDDMKKYDDKINVTNSLSTSCSNETYILMGRIDNDNIIFSGLNNDMNDIIKTENYDVLSNDQIFPPERMLFPHLKGNLPEECDLETKKRSIFIYIILNKSKQSAYIYNSKSLLFEAMKKQISCIISWGKIKYQAYLNFVNRKLQLLHHMPLYCPLLSINDLEGNLKFRLGDQFHKRDDNRLYFYLTKRTITNVLSNLSVWESVDEFIRVQWELSKRIQFKLKLVEEKKGFSKPKKDDSFIKGKVSFKGEVHENDKKERQKEKEKEKEKVKEIEKEMNKDKKKQEEKEKEEEEYIIEEEEVQKPKKKLKIKSEHDSNRDNSKKEANRELNKSYSKINFKKAPIFKRREGKNPLSTPGMDIAMAQLAARRRGRTKRFLPKHLKKNKQPDSKMMSRNVSMQRNSSKSVISNQTTINKQDQLTSRTPTIDVNLVNNTSTHHSINKYTGVDNDLENLTNALSSAISPRDNEIHSVNSTSTTTPLTRDFSSFNDTNNIKRQLVPLHLELFIEAKKDTGSRLFNELGFQFSLLEDSESIRKDSLKFYKSLIGVNIGSSNHYFYEKRKKKSNDILHHSSIPLNRESDMCVEMINIYNELARNSNTLYDHFTSLTWISTIIEKDNERIQAAKAKVYFNYDNELFVDDNDKLSDRVQNNSNNKNEDNVHKEIFKKMRKSIYEILDEYGSIYVMRYDELYGNQNVNGIITSIYNYLNIDDKKKLTEEQYYSLLKELYIGNKKSLLYFINSLSKLISNYILHNLNMELLFSRYDEDGIDDDTNNISSSYLRDEKHSLDLFFYQALPLSSTIIILRIRFEPYLKVVNEDDITINKIAIISFFYILDIPQYSRSYYNLFYEMNHDQDKLNKEKNKKNISVNSTFNFKWKNLINLRELPSFLSNILYMQLPQRIRLKPKHLLISTLNYDFLLHYLIIYIGTKRILREKVINISITNIMNSLFEKYKEPPAKSFSQLYHSILSFKLLQNKHIIDIIISPDMDIRPAHSSYSELYDTYVFNLKNNKISEYLIDIINTLTPNDLMYFIWNYAKYYHLIPLKYNNEMVLAGRISIKNLDILELLYLSEDLNSDSNSEINNNNHVQNNENYYPHKNQTNICNYFSTNDDEDKSIVFLISFNETNKSNNLYIISSPSGLSFLTQKKLNLELLQVPLHMIAPLIIQETADLMKKSYYHYLRDQLWIHLYNCINFLYDDEFHETNEKNKLDYQFKKNHLMDLGLLSNKVLLTDIDSSLHDILNNDLDIQWYHVIQYIQNIYYDRSFIINEDSYSYLITTFRPLKKVKAERILKDKNNDDSILILALKDNEIALDYSCVIRRRKGFTDKKLNMKEKLFLTNCINCIYDCMWKNITGF